MKILIFIVHHVLQSSRAEQMHICMRCPFVKTWSFVSLHLFNYY